MKVWVHFIVSIIIVLALFKFYSWATIVIFIGGVLIDVDHYLYSIIVLKEHNLKKILRFYRNVAIKKDHKMYRRIIRVFHTIEFLILIGILGLFSKYFLFVALGLYIHILLDMIYEIKIFKYITPRYSLLGLL